MPDNQTKKGVGEFVFFGFSKAMTVVYRESDKYHFAEGEVFPHFETPSFKSEARKLASAKPGSFKTGNTSPSLK